MDDFESRGRLIEELTLNRNLIDPRSPAFQHFGGSLRWWNWWGGPWPVRPYCAKYRYKDIVYTNSEGKKHRLFGPAYISRAYKIEAWYKDGELHRIGGPAYTHTENMVWFEEGKLHNLGGPAVVNAAGPMQFWIDGIKYSKKQYRWEISRRKIKGLL